MTIQTPSIHATSLYEGKIVEESDLGSMRRVTAENLPILKGLSIKRVILNPGAMRTPHWHANANEFTYCVSGTSLMSVFDNGSRFSTFVVSAGEMFHVDSGAGPTCQRCRAALRQRGMSPTPRLEAHAPQRPSSTT